MDKIQNKVSIKSRIINKLLLFTGYKKRYSSEENVKKYIDKNSKKIYDLPQKMRLQKENITCMDIFSYNGTITKPKETILLYIHGGSYVEEAMYLQIKFIKKLAEKLDATLIMPIYKIAPIGNYELFEKDMNLLYQELLKLNKKIIMVGDSAGGGLVLSYAMTLRNNNEVLPSHLLLFSPWLDVTFQNPKVQEQSELDNICSIDGNLYCGKIWSKNIDEKDYRISPIYGEFNDLPKITIITGEYDICKPDCLQLRDILRDNHYPYDYIEYHKQGHNFELYPTKEAKEVFHDVVKIINS